MGRANEAIESARQGLEVDPLSLSATMDLAWQLYMARRYEEAVAEAQKVADINPKFLPRPTSAWAWLTSSSGDSRRPLKSCKRRVAIAATGASA